MISPEDAHIHPIPGSGQSHVPPLPFFPMEFTEDQRHGLINGLDGVDKDTYEVWVSSEEMVLFLHQRQADRKKQLATLENRISESKAQGAAAQTAALANRQALETIKIQLESIDRQKQAKQAELDLSHQKMGELATSSSLFLGLLYFLAGWVFILGDLIISHEIVAYALHIRGEFESWTFAVGLALLSILVKPAYDHWIERPFLRSEGKTRYRNFHGLVAIVALVTLSILGAFRYEAFRIEQQKQDLNRQIRQLQDNLTTQSLSAVDEQINASRNALSQLSLSLVDSPKALASFILSGLLFALAGAICLGLALPILHGYWYSWFHFRPTRKRLSAQIQDLETKELHLRIEQTVNQCQWEANQSQELDTTLETERQHILHDLEAIQEKIIRARENIRISQYAEGYQRGVLARQYLTPEELQKWRSSWGLPLTKSKNPFNSFDLQT